MGRIVPVGCHWKRLQGPPHHAPDDLGQREVSARRAETELTRPASCDRTL